MRRQNGKALLFFFFSLAALGMAFPPLCALLRDTRQPEYYSHIPLVPVVSAYFLFKKRREIFGCPGPRCIPGIGLAAGGLALFLIGRIRLPSSIDFPSITAAGALIFWSGSFLFLYGPRAFRKAAFPVAFLIFAVPIPSFLMSKIISALVTLSVGMTSLFFRAIGVHFVREGSLFTLPGFNLEVAKECSGIRSSLALFITAVLAGYLFLKQPWRKAALALAVFPIAIFKNGLRIVSLYLLSYYIDMRFIEGSFHHEFAGSVFFALGLVLAGGVLWLLRRGERPAPKGREEARRPTDDV
jgi:exosortase